ncbi:MAG: hypothetical protein ACRD12_06800 [Acidimicrobiales bacterium]
MPEAPEGSGSHPLTLIMPIRKDADLEALWGIIESNKPTIGETLDQVGTVHYSRFMLFDASADNFQPSLRSPGGPYRLAVITTYDGDFDLYIEDFALRLGNVFDAILGFTTDGGGLVPVEENLVAFTDWIRNNDASQHDLRGEPVGNPTQYGAYPHSVQRIKANCGG